jgi:hypothetical protein
MRYIAHQHLSFFPLSEKAGLLLILFLCLALLCEGFGISSYNLVVPGQQKGYGFLDWNRTGIWFYSYYMMSTYEELNRLVYLKNGRGIPKLKDQDWEFT